MIWFLVSQLFVIVLTLLRLGRTSEADKDLEILILRQQLGILQRKQEKRWFSSIRGIIESA